jgi:predicted GNAT family acetyltransferase
MAAVRRNDDEGRYELVLEGGVVGLTDVEVRPDGVLVFPHTVIDEDHRGEGLSSELIGAALDDVRRRGETIVATCKRVAAFVEDHPQYADLVAEGG